MPFVIVFHNSIPLKYCNSALYSENKRYVLLKKISTRWELVFCNQLNSISKQNATLNIIKLGIIHVIFKMSLYVFRRCFDVHATR
jgi:hypothetical protein